MYDQCEHETVVDQERVFGIFFGYCAECEAGVSQTGDEDEMGVPGWEVVDESVTTEWHGHTIRIPVS